MEGPREASEGEALRQWEEDVVSPHDQAASQLNLYAWLFILHFAAMSMTWITLPTFVRQVYGGSKASLGLIGMQLATVLSYFAFRWLDRRIAGHALALPRLASFAAAGATVSYAALAVLCSGWVPSTIPAGLLVAAFAIHGFFQYGIDSILNTMAQRVAKSPQQMLRLRAFGTLGYAIPTLAMGFTPSSPWQGLGSSLAIALTCLVFLRLRDQTMLTPPTLQSHESSRVSVQAMVLLALLATISICEHAYNLYIDEHLRSYFGPPGRWVITLTLVLEVVVLWFSPKNLSGRGYYLLLLQPISWVMLFACCVWGAPEERWLASLTCLQSINCAGRTLIGRIVQQRYNTIAAQSSLLVAGSVGMLLTNLYNQQFEPPEITPIWRAAAVVAIVSLFLSATLAWMLQRSSVARNMTG
jgi:hypothetical protein